MVRKWRKWRLWHTTNYFSFENTPQSAYAIDLDNDGDNDVLSASQYDDKIAWYENDGACNFGAQQIITTDADGVKSVYAADLDNDGYVLLPRRAICSQ